jgi:hypothetical protein
VTPAPAPSRHEAEEPKQKQSLHNILDESEVPPQVTKVIQLNRAPGQDRIDKSEDRRRLDFPQHRG